MKVKKYYIQDVRNPNKKFPLDKYGIRSAIGYIKSIEKDFNIDLSHIKDLLKDFLRSGKRNILNDEDFDSKSSLGIIFEVKKFDYYITHYFYSKGYFFKKSKRSQSPSIYFYNDEQKRCRLSDHEIKKYHQNKLLKQRFEYSHSHKCRLFTGKELRENFEINNIEDGIYLLDY